MDKLLVLMLGLVIIVLLSTLFIMLGWSLFVTPVFGLKSLSFFEAFGFSLLANCFKSSNANITKAIKEL